VCGMFHCSFDCLRSYSVLFLYYYYYYYYYYSIITAFFWLSLCIIKAQYAHTFLVISFEKFDVGRQQYCCVDWNQNPVQLSLSLITQWRILYKNLM